MGEAAFVKQVSSEIIFLRARRPRNPPKGSPEGDPKTEPEKDMNKSVLGGPFWLLPEPLG